MQETDKKPVKIDFSNLSWHQMMELDACTRCGQCLKWCPVYVFDSREDIVPRTKLKAVKKIIKSQNSLISKFINPDSWLGKLICPKPVTMEDIKKAAEQIYECSTCRQCHFVCPSRIDTVELYEAVRWSFVKAGYGPLKNHMGLVTSSRDYDNPWQRPRSQRARWTKVALKEKRIDALPRMIKRPKDVAPSKSPSKMKIET